MQMGIGPIGQAGMIIKRKFRWTLAINTPCGNIPAYPCKSAARPSLEIEETEINFLNATTWVPGKAKWQPISVSYLDVASADMQGLFNWIATVYNFQNPTNLTMSEKASWNGTALLSMYDGCGTTLETWTLGSVWPQSINFGEVNYETNEFATIDLTLRYSDVTYNGNCGVTTPSACCSGC